MSDPGNNLSQIMEALQLQLENEVLWNSLRELQARNALSSQLPPQPSLDPHLLPPTSPVYSHFLEPRVTLPESFDGMRSGFRGLINHISLIIRSEIQSWGQCMVTTT